MKPFQTLDEQIKLLQSRGLEIDNIVECKRYLLTNNYYNVVNGYSKFFQTSKDKFITGADFREIAATHFYDKEIKSAFLKAIIDAEKHFKSVLAYRFSEAYPTPYAYLDINNFETQKDTKRLAQITNLISILARILNDYNRDKQNNSIKHHYKQHGVVPFWVIINELTLGQAFNFYRNLNTDIKNQIARDLSPFLQENIEYIQNRPSKDLLSGKALESIIKNILEIRNITAHNNKLFNYKCRENLPQLAYFHYYNNNANTSRQSVYYVFLALQCLLASTQYAQLHNTIIKRTKALNKKAHSIEAGIVLDTLGFPNNWYNTTDTLR
ncbi:Abi-like protein [Streptococcus mitis SK616]|jgi:hypothetical protein|nr:Abi-like protein [Streptococcus mitis SK616]DAS00154.1 MAG TPA: Abi-like protein [Caudoviricetes sp.]